MERRSALAVEAEPHHLDLVLHLRGGDAALAVTVVTWASAFPAIAVALEGYGPAALGLARLLTAAGALGLVAAASRPALPRGADVGRVVLLGLVGQTLYQLLLMSGQVRVAAGTAALLIATAPVFSVVVARVLLGERVGGRGPGLAIAFAGAALVALARGGDGDGATLAVLAVLAAALCQGAYHVLVRPVAERLGALATTTWSVVAGAALSLPALPWLVQDVVNAPPGATAAAAYLGIVPSAAGYLAWSRAVTGTSTARSTAGLYLIPVVALALAWVLLGQRPAPLALLGGGVAVLGVFLVRRVSEDSPADQT